MCYIVIDPLSKGQVPLFECDTIVDAVLARYDAKGGRRLSIVGPDGFIVSTKEQADALIQRVQSRTH